MDSYARHQLARALATADSDEDDATRRRAEERAHRWRTTIEAMASGAVDVGSRTPVRGLPAWATLEVLRGGFATGGAVAARDLEPDERRILDDAGLPRDRRTLFLHHLSEPGWAALSALLDSGDYTVRFPEEAALLTAVWLARHGDRGAALELVETLWPHAGSMRFAPVPAAQPTAPPDHVFRVPVRAARETLAARRPRPAVERQRETLTVWLPFADRVLDLWLETEVDATVGRVRPDGWLARASALLIDHDDLVVRHPPGRRFRAPGENLPILVAALRTTVLAAPLGPSWDGSAVLARVRHAVGTMVAKRGRPGSPTHAALRAEQDAVGRAPSHAALATVAGRRLAVLPDDAGLTDPGSMAGPVTSAEARAAGVPAGRAMPPVVRRTLERTRSAPLPVLVDHGLVPSGEVLAELAPALGAAVAGRASTDPALSRLVALHYGAFRRRRSLLLVDLAAQVRIDELPWVAALVPHLGAAPDAARASAEELARLTLELFPGTVVPNPLVVELEALAPDIGPWVQELAADIFTGRFSDRFRRAAQAAVPSYAGTLYEAYYDIDTQAVLGLAPPPPPQGETPPRRRWRRRPVTPPPAPTLGDLCAARAGADGSWSVAGNGTVIEQAQVLTTHNLSALGTLAGGSWAERADGALDLAVGLLQRGATQDRPLATVKQAAYAWRQCLWFLAQDLRHLDVVLARPVPDAPGLDLVLGGLRHVAAGGRFAPDGTCPGGRRLLGWSRGPHWVLAPDQGP